MESEYRKHSFCAKMIIEDAFRPYSIQERELNPGPKPGKRKRGRPKTTWQRIVEIKRKRAGWRLWNNVRAAAKDMGSWGKCVKALCATCHEVDR